MTPLNKIIKPIKPVVPQARNIFRRFDEIQGLIPTVTTVPTNTPVKLSEQIVIVVSGGETSLYVYDTENKVWKKFDNIKSKEMVVVDFTTSLTTGDGKYYIHIPASFNGMNLITVHAEVITAGITGTTDIQIRNVTDSVDMLSTELTIDSNETGSDTAVTPAVIDTTKDDVATNDLLAVDIDAISSGTAPKGLLVTLEFGI